MLFHGAKSGIEICNGPGRAARVFVRVDPGLTSAGLAKLI